MAPLVYPRQVTGTFSALPDFDFYSVNASGGSFVITIPGPTTNGISYSFSRVDINAAATVTLTPSTGTINGYSSYILVAGASVQLVSYGADWFVFGPVNSVTNAGTAAQLVVPGATSSTQIKGITSSDTSITVTNGNTMIDLSTDTGSFAGLLVTMGLTAGVLDQWLNVPYSTVSISGDYAGYTGGTNGATTIPGIFSVSSTFPRNTVGVRSALSVPLAGFTAGTPTSISVRVVAANPPGVTVNPAAFSVRGAATLTALPTDPSKAPWGIVAGTFAVVPLNLTVELTTALSNMLIQVKASGGAGLGSVNFPSGGGTPTSPSVAGNVVTVHHY